MRYLILFLFFSLPCIAGASISAPICQGETAIARPPLSLYLLVRLGYAFLIPLFLLSLTGLALSILGLKKATGWEHSKKIRRLAIAGIIMNGLVSFLGLLVLIGFGVKAQFI